MIEEDQNQMCTNSSGGDGGSNGYIITRSSSKKSKQKRVPQRGLGVAQLEKIRMEKQIHDGNHNHNHNNNVSSTSSTQNTIPLPNYSRTNDQRSSSKPCVPYSPPLCPPMPMNLAPQNLIFKTCNSLPNIENFHMNSIIPRSGSTSEIDVLQENGWPSIPVHGNVSFPKMWHPSSYNISLDHNNIEENSVFSPHLSLPYETCDIAPFPLRSSSTQTQQPTLSSMVNVSSMNSSSSSSVLHFPIEPPSNQRLYCNYSPPLLWPDDEKMMVGMKRAYPFPLDNLPIPTFDNKFNPILNHQLNKPNELTAGGNLGTTYTDLDGNIPIFRKVPPYPSSTMSELGDSRKINRIDNYNPHTLEHLTSPTFNSSLSNVKQFCRLDSLSYQVHIEDTPVDSRKGVATNQQSNMFNFFPITAQQGTTSSPSSHNRGNSKVGDNIDLNLTL